MAQVTIRNVTRATVIGTRIAVADTGFTRLIGLLGRRGLEPDTGLWIRPSSGVHTFGMLFPIDVVALDRKLRVCAVWPKLRPWRISGVSWRIHSVIELPQDQSSEPTSSAVINWRSNNFRVRRASPQEPYTEISAPEAAGSHLRLRGRRRRRNSARNFSNQKFLQQSRPSPGRKTDE